MYMFDLKTRFVAPTYSKDCYRTFLIQKTIYLGFDRNRWPKIRESETQRNTRKRDFESFKTPPTFRDRIKISETLNFPGTIRHPSFYRIAPCLNEDKIAEHEMAQGQAKQFSVRSNESALDEMV